jgi:hypothetical protein
MFKILKRGHLDSMIYSLQSIKVLKEYGLKNFTISDENLFDVEAGVMPNFPDITYDFNLKNPESENDLKNSIIVYEAIKDDMFWYKATQPEFWATICHLKYFNYIKDRIDGSAKNKGSFDKKIESLIDGDNEKLLKITNQIKGNFFTDILNTNTRLLYRNPIGKLWLIPHLTYRPWDIEGLEALKNDDDYFYTKVALTHLDLCASLFERPSTITNKKKLLNTIIYFLNEKKDLRTSRSKNYYVNDEVRYRWFLKEVKLLIAVNPGYLNYSFEDMIMSFRKIEEKI